MRPIIVSVLLPPSLLQLFGCSHFGELEKKRAIQQEFLTASQITITFSSMGYFLVDDTFRLERRDPLDPDQDIWYLRKKGPLQLLDTFLLEREEGQFLVQKQSSFREKTGYVLSEDQSHELTVFIRKLIRPFWANRKKKWGVSEATIMAGKTEMIFYNNKKIVILRRLLQTAN